MIDEKAGRADLVLEQLHSVLSSADSFRGIEGAGPYLSFLHGQASGMVLALKILFPGAGEPGEKAEELARSVLGEKGCTCRNGESGEE
ncbi:MAG: hypothetical protein K6T80_01635 [Firmicutes bacterium]|nr:hypothetical protein [Bacillota bacterium]